MAAADRPARRNLRDMRGPRQRRRDAAAARNRAMREVAALLGRPFIPWDADCRPRPDLAEPGA